ncbi:hypothetical protein NW762_011955 [Fusarium torreyae]|uniref:Integral membrane protein n=1 Tax=Fusarium torreyae TaxID=1237075 RepID=A0A9W8RNC1_9HYPO|nr:hypothetical protein NW762_011955 [Fusarium torreyae]
MGVRRFIGVILPFALTIASAIFVLVPALAGVTDKSLYIFQLNVEDLSISPASDLIHNLKIDVRAEENLESRLKKVDKNITAELLGLDKIYDITLWGYCRTAMNGTRECSSPKFDWVRKTISTGYIESADKDIKIMLPKEISKAIQTFRSMAKGAQVVFIIAGIELAITITLGIFALCSRELTCWTWMASGLAAAFVLPSAILSTILASVSIGAVETTAKFYGVRGDINKVFIAIIWIATMFAVAANILWIFPTLCCMTEQQASEDTKGLLGRNRQSSAYAPVEDDHEMQATYHNRGLTPSPRTEVAYEPYSHQGYGNEP